MKRIHISRILPHLVALACFLAVTLVYFSPILEGKRIKQSDSVQYIGMSKEIRDYRENTGREALWTNSMFGGMPAYLISVVYPKNLILYVDRLLALGMGTPAKYLFLSLLGFYILLLVFRVDPWLSIAGALAFGLSTYFFIIEAVGHNTKAHAMAYMAPILAGICLSYRDKILLGLSLTGLFLALQFRTGHFQITYYTGILVLIIGVVELIYHTREKRLGRYLKTTGLLFGILLLSIGTNIASTMLVYEYGKDSMRGKSELTSDQENLTGGLDRDYILNDYSFGIAETMNMFIPNFVGGAVGGLGTDSRTFQVLRQNNVPNAKQIVEQMPLSYWGPQRYSAGPVYIGAVVFFLFFLGIFLVNSRVRWWVLSATILAVLLAWGKHFAFLSDLFIDFFPAYNKFRTVSMILVITELTLPFLGILAVSRIYNGELKKEEFRKAFTWALGITGGTALFFSLFPGLLFSFQASFDQQLASAGWPDFVLEAVRADRQILLQKDAFRSLVFVALTASLVWFFHRGTFSKKLLVAGLALLILVDMWPVNRRYLNNDNFTTRKEVFEPFKTTQADLVILQDPDPNYRVMNLTADVFNDAGTSFFHKSIGGYHGAKMKRYQEVIEHHISRSNERIMNMLNTKYYIVPGENNQPVARRNPDALGNAWFVDSLEIVASADEEIEALGDFNPETTAIVDQRFASMLSSFEARKDTLSRISLLSYEPNRLVYEYSSASPGLAVFSEIYYAKGWKASVDGEPAGHFRCNYILRGMMLPPGEHQVEFRFEPDSYIIGEKISLASSSLLLLFFVLVAATELARIRKEDS